MMCSLLSLVSPVSVHVSQLSLFGVTMTHPSFDRGSLHSLHQRHCYSEAANTVGCTSDFVMKLSAVLNRIILIEKSGSPIPSCHSSSVSDAKLLQQNMDLHQSDFHGVFCLMTFWCVSLYPVIVGRKQDVTVE